MTKYNVKPEISNEEIKNFFWKQGHKKVHGKSSKVENKRTEILWINSQTNRFCTNTSVQSRLFPRRSRPVHKEYSSITTILSLSLVNIWILSGKFIKICGKNNFNRWFKVLALCKRICSKKGICNINIGCYHGGSAVFSF